MGWGIKAAWPLYRSQWWFVSWSVKSSVKSTSIRAYFYELQEINQVSGECVN